MLLMRHELNQWRDWQMAFDRLLDEIVSHEDAALVALYAENAQAMTSSHMLLGELLLRRHVFIAEAMIEP